MSVPEEPNLLTFTPKGSGLAPVETPDLPPSYREPLPPYLLESRLVQWERRPTDLIGHHHHGRPRVQS